MAHSLSSRSAKALVNTSGICCTIMIGGHSVGRSKKDTKSLGSTCRSANRNYSVRGDGMAGLAFARHNDVSIEARNRCQLWPRAELRLRRAPDGIYQRHSRFMQKLAHSDLRFGDDLDCTFFKRAQCEFRPASGHPGADHHGHRHFRHDFLNESEAIHARHFEVGNDDIGRLLLHLCPGNQRVCRDADFHPGISAQNGLHHLADHRRVIDNQDAQVISIHVWQAFHLPRAILGTIPFGAVLTSLSCSQSSSRWSAPGFATGMTRCADSRRAQRTTTRRR